MGIKMNIRPEKTLSEPELERYARQIILKDIGGPGQAKINKAKVLIIGAGGLGAPVLQYLTGCGVGTIGIVDNDIVSLSNLHRQIIFATSDIGKPKVFVARKTANTLNPIVKINCYPVRIDANNAADIIDDYDIIVDGSDNFTTRYIVSDACYNSKKPLIVGAVGQYEGMLTTLRPFENAPDGTSNPTWRCLFPGPPPAEFQYSCAQIGVLGPLTGIMGSLMATEVVREIVGFGTGLVGKLLIVDSYTMRFDCVEYAWDETNALNGTSR